MTTSFSNQSKSSATAFTNQTESSTSFGSINQVKAGLGWLYNQAGITYNGTKDLMSGDPVYYNGLGLVVAWSNQTKN